MSTLMGFDLERNDPAQQGGRRSSAQSPPDVYHEHIARLMANYERNRERNKKRSVA